MKSVALNCSGEDYPVRSYIIVIERDTDTDTGGFVGSVTDWPGAHSQGDTVAELQEHMGEVIAMLLEDGELIPSGGREPSEE